MTCIVRVPYHRQDTEQFCGVACAQMALELVGEKGRSWQDTLYETAHETADTAKWASAPDGLTRAAATYKVQGNDRDYALFAFADRHTANHKIVTSLVFEETPPIVLVQDSRHWVVVVGCVLDRKPEDPYDFSYSLEEVILHNPWAPPPRSPPHRPGDDCAGGGEEQWEVLAAWNESLFRAVRYGAAWSGLWIVLAGPARAPEVPSRVLPEPLSAPSGTVEPPVPGSPLPEHLSGHRPPGPEVPTSPPVAGRSLEVRELDRPGERYRIVPGLDPTSGQTRLLVRQDPATGARLASQWLKEGHLLRREGYPPAARAAETVVGRRRHLSGLPGFVELAEGDFALADELVWRPSLESLDRYFPFFPITVGQRSLYLRVDGELFAGLTTDVLGA